MAIFLSLAAAVSWGASDFFGGLAGRRSDDDRTAAITAWTQAVGMALLFVVAMVFGGTLTGQDLLLAPLAGLMGALAVAALYKGLSVGTISVIAPITGAIAASLPVVFGVAKGERPSAIAWFGIALALGSIALVAREAKDEGRDRSREKEALGLAVLSGIGFAGIFILLDAMSVESGMWPLVLMKGGGIVTATIWMVLSKAPRTPAVGTWPLIVGVGILDNAANVTYLLATRVGLLALVAVLSSLYPAFTVLLARTVLAERLQRIQIVGMLLAATGVVLMSVG